MLGGGFLRTVLFVGRGTPIAKVEPEVARLKCFIPEGTLSATAVLYWWASLILGTWSIAGYVSVSVILVSPAILVPPDRVTECSASLSEASGYDDTASVEALASATEEAAYDDPATVAASASAFSTKTAGFQSSIASAVKATMIANATITCNDRFFCNWQRRIR